MAAQAVGQVVGELKLAHAPALRKQVIGQPHLAEAARPVGAAVIKHKLGGESGEAGAQVLGSEEGAIPVRCADEAVDGAGRNYPRVGHLALVGGLVALRVENRADRAGLGRLQAMVGLETEVDLLIRGDVVIDAAREKPLRALVREAVVEGGRAARVDAEDPARTGRRAAQGPAAQAAVLVGHEVVAILQGATSIDHGDRAVASRCGVPKTERLLIEGLLARRNGIEDVILERRAGQRNGRRARQLVAQTLIIGIEEQLVLNDASSPGDRVLVGIREGPRRTRGVREEVVRVQLGAIPVVLHGPVEVVRARLGDVIHLGAGLPPVLAAVSVLNDRDLLDLVGPEREVARATVVEVQIRVHVVISVHREQVRCGGQTVGTETAVAGRAAASRRHHHPRHRERQRRNVAARHGKKVH